MLSSVSICASAQYTIMHHSHVCILNCNIWNILFLFKSLSIYMYVYRSWQIVHTYKVFSTYLLKTRQHDPICENQKDEAFLVPKSQCYTRNCKQQAIEILLCLYTADWCRYEPDHFNITKRIQYHIPCIVLCLNNSLTHQNIAKNCTNSKTSCFKISVT